MVREDLVLARGVGVKGDKKQGSSVKIGAATIGSTGTAKKTETAS